MGHRNALDENAVLCKSLRCDCESIAYHSILPSTNLKIAAELHCNSMALQGNCIAVQIVAKK